MDRIRVWLAVLPLVAGGVLVSHAVAYRLTRTPGGSLHGYLEHAPQALVLVALVGALAGIATRRRMPAAWPFPAAALLAFAAQEHVERVAHTGDVPWLLASPAFLVGILLQVPVALAAWALSRWLLGGREARGARPPALPATLLSLVPRHEAEPRRAPRRLGAARAPPLLHHL